MIAPAAPILETYDPQNLFGKILRGELPSFTVFEDARTLAFLDIFPLIDGHCLVIPKAPVRNLLDASPQVLADCLTTVQRVARAQILAFGADGISIRQNNEKAGGQDVFHLHYHVLPRQVGIAMKPPGAPRAADAVLTSHAEALRTAINAQS